MLGYAEDICKLADKKSKSSDVDARAKRIAEFWFACAKQAASEHGAYSIENIGRFIPVCGYCAASLQKAQREMESRGFGFQRLTTFVAPSTATAREHAQSVSLDDPTEYTRFPVTMYWRANAS